MGQVNHSKQGKWFFVGFSSFDDVSISRKLYMLGVENARYSSGHVVSVTFVSYG